MEARYNIYFAGQLLEGQDLSTVRSKLAKIFNADEPTLDKLFSGKTQLLKRDCDKATALKYKQAIERAGGQPVIKAVEVAAAPVETAPVTPAMSAAERIAALAAAPEEIRYGSSNEAAAAAPAQEDSTTDGVGLAPAGSDVLREDERCTPVAREIDTSGLAVDASAQRLSEESAAPPAAPDTSHLDMGEVGEMIPNLPSHEKPLSPNIDSIDLAPDGTDFSDCATPEAAEPVLDLSELNLAPEGAELLDEEYRKHDQATAPATDHIALED
jgi:hypothetical protein